MTGKKILAVIPARKGSKGVARKNVADLGGQPLITWTVRAAIGAEEIDDVIVSTNDSEVITISAALGCHVPFVRAESLSTDSASGVDVLVDAVQRCPGYDTVVYLQPTSPFRTAAHIDAAMKLMNERGATQCVSVVKHDKPPSWLKMIDADGRLRPYFDLEIHTNRQMSVSAYLPNGAIYISDVETLLRTKTLFTDDSLGYLMDAQSSIDIDTDNDLEYARYLITRGLVDLR